ncbi:RNase H domain-containing protein, partial [Caerostris darwini]
MWQGMNSENFNSSVKYENTGIISSPFQVKTLPLIKKFHNKFIDEEPSIYCTSSPLYIIVAEYNKISIFSEDSLELLWNIEIEEKVCCVSLSDDSCLLLIAETSGQIQLFHIPTKTSLWSYICQKTESPSITEEAFIISNCSDFLKIYILTREKIVLEFSNISVSSIYNAIENEDKFYNFDTVNLKEMDLKTFYPECKIINIFQMFCNHSVIGLGIQSLIEISDLTLFSAEDGIMYDLKPDWEYNLNEEELFKCYDFSANDNAIKAVNTRDGNYIVFLNQKHFINIMCSYTFIVLETLGNHNGKGSIKDFVLNEAVDQNSCLVSDCKIGLLMETESENFTYVFEIRKFPSFEIIYSFNLSQFAKIAECKPNQDFWYLIDGSVLEDSGEKYVTDLSVKAVSEALPEARLLGLVNRRKFVEAEKLAKESDLNFEVIYKTKFKCILNDLSLNKYINSSESEIDNVWKELLEVLNHIKDVEFVKSAILYPLTNASFMKKLLFCIKDWLIKNEEVQSIQDVISQINKVLNKITTHEIISKDNESYLNLKDFLAKDLSDYLISEFQNGNLNTTFIIWQRHKDELLLSLNEDSIKQILQALPDLLPSQHLISFLCDDFLPLIFLNNFNSI